MLDGTFRDTSASVYMIMLACGDMVVLIVGLIPELLDQLHVMSLWEESTSICRVELYMYYTIMDFSIWTLMLFNIDRCVAVCSLLGKIAFCTKRQAYIFCGFAFLAANLNLHVFWSRGAIYNNGSLISNCAYLPDYLYFEQSVRPVIVLWAAHIIPFFIIAVTNIIVMLRALLARRQRRLNTNVSYVDNDDQGCPHLSQVTILCLSCAIAFLILNLPSIILFIGKTRWRGNDWYPLARAITSQLTYIHHAINPVLYSLFGKRFRTTLAALFRRQPSEETSYLNMQSLPPKTNPRVSSNSTDSIEHTV
ncbi:hypothetical protein LSH36_4g06002 [Paralvinella palmiformis]|uniref:G-protein coupled receptors family 1 profile domain-containing protein n=1 Tax=Paralvinella palmiformis TaxID=53620 RepID=A0AAD9NK45_9ANNE|nr:hypothetical protein LSH36_4g06002 [Paralvinella palmiformis]